MLVPVEPPPSRWDLPEANLVDDDFVGAGADLHAGTLLQAYRKGLFPMPIPEAVGPMPDDQLPIGWWSPDPRGVLPLDGLIVSKSLRRACRDYEIRVDTAFREVIAACADPSRPHGWINDSITDAYVNLFDLGWAHSVEAWHDGQLVGGLYGIAINGLFAGESMFHRRRDASKVALVGLVDMLNSRGFTLLDVQWKTEHLASLGVVDVPRLQYKELLKAALLAESRPFV